MPAAVCPHCQAELDLEAEYVGTPVECPACNRAFTAPLAIDQLVPRQTPVKQDQDDTQDLIDHARSECSGPASALSIFGGLTAILGFLTVLIAVMRVFGWLNAPTALGLSTEVGMAVYIAVGLASIVTGGFQVYAARLMHRAEHYPICVLACITAVVNPCCVGILLGLNGLNRLRDPWVKLGFAANRPGYDPDQN
jgi:hypothetical protein